MKQRALVLLLAFLLVFTGAACGQNTTTGSGEGPKAVSKEALKVGLLLPGDAADPESQNHISGMQRALEQLDLDAAALVPKTKVPADDTAQNSIQALLGEGCQVIFATDAGYESIITQLARSHPKVQFCTAMGTQSASDELPNTHNYYARVFEVRYLAGLIAGLKTTTNKLGYVATKKDPSVISGYIAYFLGAKSVNPDIRMFVNYTQEDPTGSRESDNVQALLGRGCDILTSHAGSNVPAIAAEDWGRHVIGFNNDLLPLTPSATLASARVDWGVYYTHALAALLDGRAIEQDWCEGLSERAVYLSELNQDHLDQSILDTVALVEEGLMDASIRVFRGPLYDANGMLLVKKGMFFDENDEASAPNWNVVIKGITVLS